MGDEDDSTSLGSTADLSKNPGPLWVEASDTAILDDSLSSRARCWYWLPWLSGTLGVH